MKQTLSILVAVSMLMIGCDWLNDSPAPVVNECDKCIVCATGCCLSGECDTADCDCECKNN